MINRAQWAIVQQGLEDAFKRGCLGKYRTDYDIDIIMLSRTDHTGVIRLGQYKFGTVIMNPPVLYSVPAQVFLEISSPLKVGVTWPKFIRERAIHVSDDDWHNTVKYGYKGMLLRKLV